MCGIRGFRIPRRRKIRPGGDTDYWKIRAQRQEDTCGMDRAALKAREMCSWVQPVDMVR